MMDSKTTPVQPGPSHDEIAQCASELWTESGCPQGRDEAIWYEAERRLISARRSGALEEAALLLTRRRVRPQQRANGQYRFRL